jgi:multidrug efflux pump subunit AcrB
MKHLAEFSVKNSLFVNLLSVFLIIAGLSSLLHLKREAFPPVSFDVVTVNTYFRGADSEKVERLVTTALENELKEVNNIEEMVSSSNDDVSLIYLKISSDVKDKNKVVNDIQRAVDRVSSLPHDVDERPIVTEITSGQIPVIKVGLSGNLSEFKLRELADHLKDLLEGIDGVSSVNRIGWRDEEFWVQPDINKMLQFHISFAELADALRRQNVDLPGGKLKRDTDEFSVKVKADFKNKEDIENTIIRGNDLGNWLRVKDVATVKHTFEDDIILNKVLSTRAITLVVIKRESGDILKIVDNVNRIIKDFSRTAPEELKISTFYDISYYVQRRLGVLRSNGYIALILVIGILFLFLHPIPATMTALGIPIAMLTTFWIMDILGLSINLITMFGLIIVLGMVVDDGIIISENTYRYLEKGFSPREAAINGTTEVMFPVLATILTTIAAFSPLMFMKGLIGRFVKYIPFVAIIALLASLVEAFFILPSHLADFVKPIKKENHGRSERKWFQYILEKYKRLLEFSMRNRYKVITATIVAFIFSLILAKFFMPFILFSSEGVEQFSLRLEAKPGTSLQETNRLIKKPEELIAAMPAKYLDVYETIVGRLSQERGFDPNAREGSNLAQINVYLTPSGKRDKTAREIINSMKPALEKIFNQLKSKGVEKLYFQEFKEGPPVGRDIDLRIRGVKFSRLKIIASEIEQYLHRLKGVSSITDSYDLGKKQINIIVDENKAAQAYLTNSDIAFAIRCAFAGAVATTIKRSEAEKEVRVLVRLPKEQQNNLDIFNKILIRNKFDNLIPLSSVATIEYCQSLGSIKHLDGKRFISVTADVDNRHITSLKANNLLKKRFKNLSNEYPGYALHFSGENKETMESLVSLFKAFIIAILVIFLILATLFNSLIQPFIVMLTIPFALIGVVFAFLIHFQPLSFLAILGLVGLCGVVVNDSIVLVDFINKLRVVKKDASIYAIVKEAGMIRLRPVILTTLTTIAGLGTVAYGIGGSDPFLKPMALSISWGLLFATFLTLIVIPCVYLITEDIKALVRRKF